MYAQLYVIDVYRVFCDCVRAVSWSASCAHYFVLFFFLMIRRPPRSTLDRSSAASDVYKRQAYGVLMNGAEDDLIAGYFVRNAFPSAEEVESVVAVSYIHLRAHETVLDLVCRLLLEKKKKRRAQK